MNIATINNDESFYLEISPRQTGKTFRLIQDIVSNIDFDRDFHAYMACPNMKMFDYIVEEVKKNCRIAHAQSFSYISSINDIVTNANQLNNKKYYFDDFDFIEQLTPHNVEFVRRPEYYDCYFTTSLRKPRKPRKMNEFTSDIDVLAKLLELNNGMCISSYRRYNDYSKDIIHEQYHEYLNHIII